MISQQENVAGCGMGRVDWSEVTGRKKGRKRGRRGGKEKQKKFEKFISPVKT